MTSRINYPQPKKEKLKYLISKLNHSAHIIIPIMLLLHKVAPSDKKGEEMGPKSSPILE